jgi:hypothetical protein
MSDGKDETGAIGETMASKVAVFHYGGYTGARG